MAQVSVINAFVLAAFAAAAFCASAQDFPDPAQDFAPVPWPPDGAAFSLPISAALLGTSLIFSLFDPAPDPFPEKKGSVQIWQGCQDKCINMDLQRYVARKLRWIRYYEVPEGGHCLVYDAAICEAIFRGQTLATAQDTVLSPSSSPSPAPGMDKGAAISVHLASTALTGLSLFFSLLPLLNH
nr:Lysophospholipase BODYGUARD 1 precursor [Ipomoea batatas]